MATDEEGRVFPDVPEGIAKGEPHPEQKDFVVVLAYTSDDEEIEEDFGKLVNDIKALYTFKQNVRVYAVVEESAKRVLAKVEKQGEPSGRGVMVISYDLSDDTDESVARLSRTADTVRDLFKDEYDVRVDVAIRDAADEVLGVFKERE